MIRLLLTRISANVLLVKALPRRELHPFLASKEIQDGSIVLITKYRLTKAKKLSSSGDIWFVSARDTAQHSIYRDLRLLLLDSMQPVGVDGRIAHDFTIERLSNLSQTSTAKSLGVSDQSEGAEVNAREALGDHAFETRLSGLGDQKRASPAEHSASESEAGPPSPSETASRKRKQKEQPNTPTKAPLPGLEARAVFDPERQPLGAAIVTDSSKQPISPGAPKLKLITRPLKLTALSGIIGPKATRNRVVDVVGVICEVNPDIARRPKMPDQRDIRIMDTSTTKKVQLTVFVDAINFLPKVGTVALFRSVTTHEWNGGSLKAYPRDCEGRDWFLPGRVDESAAEELRAWWLQNSAKEEAELEKRGNRGT